MIDIQDEKLFGEIVASLVADLGTNPNLNTGEQIRYVNAVAKATVRIQEDGAFIDWDPKTDTMVIWSRSNEIYEIKADRVCQCKAAVNGHVCWHRAAKRLVAHYTVAEAMAHSEREFANMAAIAGVSA
jgi:hypothetical protein